MEREDEKNERREGGGEGEAGARNPDWNIRGSNAPGLEHPGKQCARTGTSGGRKPWTGTSGEATAREWNVQDLRRRRKWRRREATRSK